MMMHVDTEMVEQIASKIHCDAIYYIMDTADALRLEMGPAGVQWNNAPRTTIEFVGFRDNGDCIRGMWIGRTSPWRRAERGRTSCTTATS